ncbi:FAD:protein FMN transferase [bacterium AH-315-P07]|nr:FAD:protein FMN transferase [bacterium AH-315-P07]
MSRNTIQKIVFWVNKGADVNLLRLAGFTGICTVICFNFGLGLQAAHADAGALSDFNLPDEISDDRIVHFVHQAMGTEFTFMVCLRPGDVGRADVSGIVQKAFDEIDLLERQISSWNRFSDTSEVNRFGSVRPVEVRYDAFELFQFSAQMYVQTQGVFDITVGPLIDLRREALKQSRDPDPEEIAKVLQRIGMDQVVLDPEKRSVFFKKPGMRVSFGGIGKGLALDHAAKILRDFGITNALLNGGRSSMLALGAPPGKQFWKIGLRNPYNDFESLDFIDLRDQALSTSACYNELARVKGKPCEIYDPRTGNTAKGLWSATVIAQSGMQTDALSTAFYIVGMDGVRDYCADHPEVYAILVPEPEYEGQVPDAVRIGKK